MKNLIILTLISFSFIVNAQDTLTTFFDKDWKETTEENAEFYRKTYKQNKLWFVNDYFQNGQLQMSGSYKTKKIEKERGAFTFYFKNGQKKDEGEYDKKGRQIGIWNYYFENGQMSAKETYDKGKLITDYYWNEDGIELIGDEKKKANNMPSFPGGEQKLYDYLALNIKYPPEAKSSNISGRVLVNFIVEIDGSIDKAYVFGSVHPLLDAEALRIVKNMPKWETGKQHNRDVRVSYNLPIKFTLQNSFYKSGNKIIPKQ